MVHKYWAMLNLERKNEHWVIQKICFPTKFAMTKTKGPSEKVFANKARSALHGKSLIWPGNFESEILREIPSNVPC